LAVIGAVVLASLVLPLFLKYGPYTQTEFALQGPSAAHPLGTDEVGRDLLARVLAGTRVDLAITLIAVPLAALLGTLLGLIGFLSSVAGSIWQRIFDVLLGIPAVILGVGTAVALGPGATSVTTAIVLAAVPIFGRQARAGLLAQVHQDYVAAARVLGYSRTRIMLRHILPNMIDVILIRSAVVLAEAVMIEGGLSVVGLGIQLPQASLGSMTKAGSSYLLELPTYALTPVVVVLILAVGYISLSDALNKAVLRR
jgi:peptide/nickel transport system permease protein